MRIRALRFGRLARMPVQRGALAPLVAGVLVAGVIAALPGSGACASNRNKCSTYGIVSWSQPLAGSWVAQNDVEGTII